MKHTQGGDKLHGGGLKLVPVLAAALITLLAFIPLVRMFFAMDATSFRAVFESGSIGEAVGNSVLAALLATVISVVMGFLLAWCVERTRMPCKAAFRLLFVVPMLIPSVSLGMGTVLLRGNNGLLTNLLGLSGSIYGLPGIVLGSVLYSFPVAFLLLDNILKYEDSSPYEAARVLGIPRLSQFAAISAPYLSKPLISAVFAVFTLVFTDYGVPLMVGGKFKTLPVLMYQQVIGQLDFGRGCVYGCILLIPAVVAFVLDVVFKNRSNLSYVTRPFLLEKKPLRDTLATVFSAAVSVLCVLPIAAFVVLAFVSKYPTDLTLTLANLAKTLAMDGGTYFLNSVVIALLVAALGTALCVLTAYITARTRSKLNKYLHLLSMASMAIPGIVLGLSYILLFKGSFLYGTLMILVMVNITHFFASPYLLMYTSFSKMNENLEAAGATLGIGRVHMLLGVLVPQAKHTVWEMFSYFFINSMMTISAVSFLATTSTKPVALMINQFESQAQLECAAVISLAILVVNLVIKLLVQAQSKRRDAQLKPVAES